MRSLLSFLFVLFLAPVADADFGNWFVANKRLATILDSSTQKISYRFTCQEDMTLTAAALYCVQATRPPAYLVSLQEDQDGIPSGTSLSSTSYVPASQNWSTLPMDPVPLLKNKVYHLVVEQDTLRGGGHPVGVIDPAHFASFLSTDILNHLHPNDGSPDSNTNTLYFENGKWRELNQEPVYAIYGTGSHFQGNPYDDPGVRPIYGNDKPHDAHQVLQGQSLHFHCGFQAQAVALRIKKQGNPKAPLNLVVLKNDYRSHRNIPLFTQTILVPDKAPSHFEWVTIGFADPSTSHFSPECWFFALQTDSGHGTAESPGCSDCYLVSDIGNSGGLPRASDLTFDGGPHLSRTVFSIDGEDPFHWKDLFERDSNVGALGPPCRGSAPREFKPLATPLPLDSD